MSSGIPTFPRRRTTRSSRCLDLDADLPAGAILHVAGAAEDGFLIAEVWQTEQTFQAFFDYRFRPAVRMHGIHAEPTVDVAPLRNIFAAEMSTVERLGSVSLPATYAGAVL